MNHKIYITGDKLEQFYKSAISEYDKRLSKYCKIQLQYFKKPDQLLSKIQDNDYKILIITNDQTQSSEELASKIDTLGISGVSSICYVISDRPLDFKSDEQLALSSFDMSLGLKTTILYEQIYRSYRIIHNQAYHK